MRWRTRHFSAARQHSGKSPKPSTGRVAKASWRKISPSLEPQKNPERASKTVCVDHMRPQDQPLAPRGLAAQGVQGSHSPVRGGGQQSKASLLTERAKRTDEGCNGLTDSDRSQASLTRNDVEPLDIVARLSPLRGKHPVCCTASSSRKVTPRVESTCRGAAGQPRPTAQRQTDTVYQGGHCISRTTLSDSPGGVRGTASHSLKRHHCASMTSGWGTLTATCDVLLQPADCPSEIVRDTR